MLAAIHRLALYLNTVRWLRVSQLYWQVYRRVRPVINPRTVPVEPHREDILSAPTPRSPQPERYEFRFLNKSRAANPRQIDWHPQDETRLWRYNLHYFDFLLWEAFPAEHKADYIDSWIERNPVGTVDAWEPYTLSLRLVNWIKYFDSLSMKIPEHWSHSLLNQAVWLEANLEHHILANHLLKNAKALVFAGAVFDGPNGQRILRKGLELVLREAAEQILPDGGHYERSPMYHCIVLEDYLDICNLLASHPSLAGDSEQKALRDTAVRALQFLEAILGADGKIPLFNDAAYGIAPEPPDLLAYGERVAGRAPATARTRPQRIYLPRTGYYGYRNLEDSMLIDCGPVGPDYQPGHAHCDALSYVLCVDGRQLVVDSGVRGYENDSLREYVRSTAAHNTVSVAGHEQSEVWGTFRVARRARASVQKFSDIAKNQLSFSGSHNGYNRLPGRIEHGRDIVIDLGGKWTVCDRLTGSGECEAVSFVHFHPDIEVVPQSEGRFSLNIGGEYLAEIRVAGNCETSLFRGHYCPEFGIAIENVVLIIRVVGALPLDIEYEIARAA